ncbi:MAG: type II toxin-antitoxin system VapC family toxin [Acetobacteraceae bacterium]
MTAGYLADACALIVFLACRDADRIMPRAAALMRSQEIRVSPITVWEITRKAALGKLPPVWTPYSSLSLLLRAQGYAMQPLGSDETEQANRLPPVHKDPMDRMLIATALRHDLAILTDDAVFAAYGVETVW